MTLFEANREAVGRRLVLNLPRLSVRVDGMLQALEAKACTQVRQRVHFERNKRVARMVANWTRGATAHRALALGLRPDASFKVILERHIQDCRQPTYPADTLGGQNR